VSSKWGGIQSHSVVILVDHLAGEGFARHGGDFIGKGGELIEPRPKLLARALGRPGYLYPCDTFGERLFKDLDRRLVG